MATCAEQGLESGDLAGPANVHQGSYLHNGLERSRNDAWATSEGTAGAADACYAVEGLGAPAWNANFASNGLVDATVSVFVYVCTESRVLSIAGANDGAREVRIAT